MEKPLREHVFLFNYGDNSGESLSLTTKFYDNGNRKLGLPAGIFTHQELTLNSYCNSASIKLCSILLNSFILRELANQLEKVEKEVMKSLKNT